jgi:hypothetical protein
MLVQIDENWATLTPFGSLARHIPLNAPTAETKSWSELLRWVLSQTRQKGSQEIPAEPQVSAPNPPPSHASPLAHSDFDLEPKR